MLSLKFLTIAAVTLAVVQCAPQRAAGSQSSDGHVWAIVRLTECSGTCAKPGTQRAVFGCYATNSSRLLRLPGTGVWIADSETEKLPPHRCTGAMADPSAVALTVSCQRDATSCRPQQHPQKPRGSWWWQLDLAMAALAPCQRANSESVTTACDQPGFVRLSLRCSQRIPAAGGAPSHGGLSDDSRCLAEGLQRPGPISVPCRRLAGCRPVWKAGPWAECSRQCALGEKARTVECSQLKDTAEGPVFTPTPGGCSGDGGDATRPHSREYCIVRPECPPYYRLKPGKCMPSFTGAAPGNQRRCNETGLQMTNAECVQLVGDADAGLNQTKRRPFSDCLGISRPPPFQRCRVDNETLKQRGIACVEPDATELSAPPRLMSAPPGSLLVQTERMPEMEARCGQSATLIPGTRLRLHCAVANFKATDLHWRKLGRKRPFPAAGRASQRRQKRHRVRSQRRRKSGGGNGRGVCKRICVVNGDLLFRRFKPKDAGTYEVTAGEAKATVRLNWHTAYEAFLGSYLPRVHLLRRAPSGSPSASDTGGGAPFEDDSKRGLWARDAPGRSVSDWLAWMTDPWTECPPCDSVGDGPRRRTRTVRCERLHSGAYAVVEDAVCAKNLGPAPSAVEDCGHVGCPAWQHGDWDGQCPVSRCYLKGISLMLRKVTCADVSSNATLPESECLRMKLPRPESARECPNSDCQPEWSVGNWSSCSISCGAYGYCSRSVRCLWRGTGRAGGLACEHLPLPRSYKPCYQGPCRQLGCVDLSPFCKIYQASGLCAHASLRRNCCETCHTYQLQVYQSLKKP